MLPPADDVSPLLAPFSFSESMNFLRRAQRRVVVSLSLPSESLDPEPLDGPGPLLVRTLLEPFSVNSPPRSDPIRPAFKLLETIPVWGLLTAIDSITRGRIGGTPKGALRGVSQRLRQRAGLRQTTETLPVPPEKNPRDQQKRKSPKTETGPTRPREKLVQF